MQIQEAIERLDPNHFCCGYWDGKADRAAAAAGLPAAPTDGQCRRCPGPPRQHSKRAGQKTSRSTRDMDEAGDVEVSNRWSVVSRSERYRARCDNAAGSGSNECVGMRHDADNPLPGLIDPITLGPASCPAISPYGHVMGLASWKVCKW